MTNFSLIFFAFVTIVTLILPARANTLLPCDKKEPNRLSCELERWAKDDCAQQLRKDMNCYIKKAAFATVVKYKHKGYDLVRGRFTHDLSYGNGSATLRTRWTRVKQGPSDTMITATMCNSAVTQVFVEAINEYAKTHKVHNGRSIPDELIDAKYWNRTETRLGLNKPYTGPTTDDFYNLRAYFFGNKYSDQCPFIEKAERLKRTPPVHCPDEFDITDLARVYKDIKADIARVQSDASMGLALSRLGLGQGDIEFDKLEPGDVISFDRWDALFVPDLSKKDPKHTPSGHAAIFLAFIDAHQRFQAKYQKSTTAGFAYISSQKHKSEVGGFGIRLGFFRTHCPYDKKIAEDAKKILKLLNPVKDGKPTPANPKDVEQYTGKAYCADRLNDRAAKLTETVFTDCCIHGFDLSNKHRPRGGRLYKPEDWKFESSYRQIAAVVKKIDDSVTEYRERHPATSVSKDPIQPQQISKAYIALSKDLGTKFTNQTLTINNFCRTIDVDVDKLSADIQKEIQIGKPFDQAIDKLDIKVGRDKLLRIYDQMQPEIKRELEARVAPSAELQHEEPDDLVPNSYFDRNGVID